MNTAPSRILIAVPDNIGDAVMGTVLLEPLRRAFPGVEIGMWVKRYASGVFPSGGPVRIHAADPAWDRAPGSGKGAWPPLLREFISIREARYDTALVLNAEWRRTLCLRLAGIPVRIGVPRRRNAARMLTRSVEPLPTATHAAREHLALLKALPGPPAIPDRPLPRLWLPAPTNPRRPLGRGRTRALIVLHPISGDPLKNWPLSHWTRLARLLRDSDGARCVVLSSPGEGPVLSAAFARLPAGTARVKILSLERAAALLRGADLFIGGDSGPGHIAAALGTPVLSLFGPTSPERYLALGEGPVQALRCDPLADLDPSEVASAARELLGNRSPE